ncbi:kinesin-like protein KIF28P isoform X1 [Haliotis rufescens]|uniref:kinesin-like protein KIF28P isoform X1 n=1 Tax=Haliotis rufescens TaxID=6454 RepID=UPI00201FA398|nr:kinesin-like protein KIF28P isoform X1 [Haliotis rufescens]
MPGGGGDSVKVAVRVRPFNQREKNAGSKCIVSMDGKTTRLTNPANGEVKSFAFDQSYWSHDSFTEDEEGIYERESPESSYADQRRVFEDLGQGVLDNAWQGYNAALFAYGQTGSGKSYSMIGYNANKGIVPITCGELFKAIDDNEDNDKQLRVSFSMLEIYNEQVRDLLAKGKQQIGGLKVRLNPKIGFYVEGLKLVPVKNYKQIEKLMEQGTYNRTTASTNMNATSSRSHMVITIKFEQVFPNAMGQSTTKSSEINLVDLAGSERANSTGATGDRLKEGSAINQSLSSLGNVISALADQAMGKKKVMVPYRDSVLTKLLQSALGGNSRTIMIAALSPADINYDETLSTLRYADRAKKIQNKAVVNESPTDRLIRELKEENAKLMALLGGKGAKPGADTNLLEQQLQENQRKMSEMQQSWDHRLEAARRDWEKEFLRTDRNEWEINPYLMNVNEDPQLTGVVKHALVEGSMTIGKSGDPEINIALKGLGIQKRHAIVENDGGSVWVRPCVAHAQVIINGSKVKQKQELHHMDRVKLGSSSLFLYIGFQENRSDLDQVKKYSFDYFMTELAEHEGIAVELHTPRDFDTEEDHVTTVVYQEYVDLMPAIAEANAISEELNKKLKFEPEVKSQSSHDTKAKAKEKEIIVRVTNVQTKKVWIWSKSKFLHRKLIMNGLYTQFMEQGEVTVSEDQDPFWDPVEPIFLGSCHVWLKMLAYSDEIDEHFTLHNYHGKEEAVVHVQLLPCDKAGVPLQGESMVFEPEDLKDKAFYFLLKVPTCMSVRWTMEDATRGVMCKLRFFEEKEPLCSQKVWGSTMASLNYQKHFSYMKMPMSLLQYFQRESLVVELWGTQGEKEVRHTNGIQENGNQNQHVTALTNKLEQLNTQLEEIDDERATLKKENFKLRTELERQKQAVKLARVGRGSFNELPVSRSTSSGSNSGDVPKTHAVGLDVELAKSIKTFFQDMRSVQQQIKDMKTAVTTAQSSNVQNGNLKAALQQQSENLVKTEDQINVCLKNLKQSVVNTIKKSKDSS